ncbi:MAG: hypothetical protein MJ072_04125, partial [Clostridia bacterium]|nr:hypothetical protein [Clostridia bacterium]
MVNQAWGTDKFFNNVKFLIENAVQRGITPWLYDEDAYPSGQVGGKLVIDRPELLSYGIQVDKVIADENSVAKKILGKVKGLYAYVVKEVDGKEKVEILKDCFGPVRRNWYKMNMTKTYYADMADMKYDHIRGCTCYTEIMFEADVPAGETVYVAYLKPAKTDMRYGTLVSCLNRQTTDEIIKRVYERYKAYVGRYFGKEVPGIFIDEASVGFGLPYTEQLSEYFFNTYGYSFEDNIYKLSSEYSGDSASLRRDYVSSIKALFTENFVRPLSNWCKANNLKLVGHFLSEENPLFQAITGQDVYNNVGLLDIPGFDVITAYIGDYKRPSLIMGANLVASSASQHGKDTVLAECFALSPYNYGYDGLKRTADWLFASGINWIVPHAFYYGYCAFQRTDAGKSFFFQDDLFEDYLKFSRYAERTCKLLRKYKRENDYLVVIPDKSFSEEVPFPVGNSGIAPSKRALSIQENLHNVIRFCIS